MCFHENYYIKQQQEQKKKFFSDLYTNIMTYFI